MGTVLFATVGGSPEPIVKSVENFKPGFTYFIVTDHTQDYRGSIDTVVGDYYIKGNEKFETIPKRLGLTGIQFNTIIVEADNPFDVYEKVVPYVEKHLKNEDRVHVDCTGGTKSMSVGLAFVHAEYPETHLSIVTGPRFDLLKVINGKERVKKFKQNNVYYARQIKNCESFIANRDYNAAHKVLEKLSSEMQIEDEAAFNRLFHLSQGFDAWDKFQYETALSYIEPYRDDMAIEPYYDILVNLIHMEKLAKTFTPETDIPTKNGFLLVYDLLYNAERKANANYYDDAVSRIYRAVEMYEQFALFTNDPKLDTGNMDVSLLPEHIRESFFKGNDRRVIGLRNSYDLLQSLGHPIGDVWAKYKEEVLHVLDLRNYSYFAHGFNPVSKEDYETMKTVVWNFIYECDKVIGFEKTIHDYVQLPNKFSSFDA